MRFYKCFFGRVSKRVTRRARAAKAAPRKVAKSAKRRVRKLTTRAGGGGIWRLFVSRRARNVRGKPDFKLIAQAFRALSDDEKNKLRPDADDATAVHAAGGLSFGPQPRLQESRLSAAVKRRRIELLAYGGAEAMVSQSLCSIGGPVDVDVALRAASDDARGLRKLQRETDLATHQKLTAWKDGHGASILSDAFGHVAELAPYTKCLSTDHECVGGATFSWFCPTHADVPRLVAIAKQSTRLWQSLLTDWEALHRVVCHAEVDALPKEPTKNYNIKHSCNDAMVCLCGQRGDSVWEFRCWLVQQLKRHFGPGCNALLSGGDVVLRLRGFPPEDYAHGDDFCLESPGPLTEVDMFFHVSNIDFSPYKFTLRLMLWSGGVDVLGNLRLDATHEYNLLLPLLHKIWLRGLLWSVTFFELLDTDEPVAHIDGTSIRVRRSPCTTPVETFHKPRLKAPAGSGGGSKPRAPKLPSLFQALDDLPDNDVESDGAPSELGSGVLKV